MKGIIMKTILRIIMILLVAAIVAGAFSLAVNNGSTTAASNDAGQSPTTTSTNGQTFQPITRPEGGDRDGGSIAGGLGGVLGTLAKITGITILVLAIQKAIRLIENRRLPLVS